MNFDSLLVHLFVAQHLRIGVVIRISRTRASFVGHASTLGLYLFLQGNVQRAEATVLSKTLFFAFFEAFLFFLCFFFELFALELFLEAFDLRDFLPLLLPSSSLRHPSDI